MSFQEDAQRTGNIVLRKVKRRGEIITAAKQNEQVDLLLCMQPLKVLVEELNAEAKELIAIKEYCQ